MTVDVEPTKSAQSRAVEEAVCWIDIVHVIHETEWSVGQQVLITFQPGDCLDSKAPNIVRTGLVTAIKVLASKLCDTDRYLESVVPGLDVGLEVRECHVVPM